MKPSELMGSLDIVGTSARIIYTNDEFWEIKEAVLRLERGLDKALGAIDGEREPCPLCGNMYWAGDFGHSESCLVYREPL